MENKLIEVFIKIRDIPYHIPETPAEIDYRCWGKNRILLEEFKKLGYESRLRVCLFSWNKQNLPEEIIKYAPSNLDIHPFVEIKINDKWIKVDATLDPKFKKHNVWDGKTDTNISIVYDKIYSPKESEEINNKEDTFKKSKEWFLFAKKLNNFFELKKKRQI